MSSPNICLICLPLSIATAPAAHWPSLQQLRGKRRSNSSRITSCNPVILNRIILGEKDRTEPCDCRATYDSWTLVYCLGTSQTLPLPPIKISLCRNMGFAQLPLTSVPDPMQPALSSCQGLGWEQYGTGWWATEVTGHPFSRFVSSG